MPVILNAGEGSYVLLLKRMKRIAIAQDCQPQGCGCRAYMDGRYLLLQYLHFLHPCRSFYGVS